MNNPVKPPLISVVVPVYNVEKYINKCIDSIVNQNYTNLEIILVNDGSTDNSLDICKDYASKDSRVILIDQKNQGLSGARNSGIEIAKGKYISFLDSDDWLESTTFEKAILIAEEKQCDLVFWKFVKEFENKSVPFKGVFYNNTFFEGKKLEELHRRLAGPLGNELQYPQLIDSFVSAWGKLFLRDIIKNNSLRFIDTKIVGSEDILFSFQYFRFIKNAYFLNEYLMHYRKDNPYSLTKSHGSTLFPRFCKLFEHMHYEIERNNLGDNYKKALNNRICISMMNIGLSEISPKIEASAFKRINTLKGHLNSKIFRIAYRSFQFNYLRPHWYIYYYFCKMRFGIGVYLMLRIMRMFANK